VSVFHLQRTFKRVMGISPKQYLRARRFGNFKALVRKGESVTNSLYESGFNSSSRLYEHAAKNSSYTSHLSVRGVRGVNIQLHNCRVTLGRLLSPSTERGVCAVRIATAMRSLSKTCARSFRKHRSRATIHSCANPAKDTEFHLDHN
jgi:AraC family transcriptional regulator of adaptative response/methylated-DNA-[protein]-cysteine methyltransferase